MSKPKYELQDLNDTVKALADEYDNDAQKKTQLDQAVIDAKAKLAELEEDIDLSFDEVAAKSTVLNRDVERCEFESRAITKRLAMQRQQLVRGIHALENKTVECDRATNKERRAKMQEIIESDEWQKAQKLMWAADSLRGNFWENTIKDMKPVKPTIAESREAARECGLWIEDVPTPEAINYAKTAIGFNSNDKR